ncbi:MAG: sulfite exporter TauE/SafE family protein [Bacteroidales bacterium]|nr:sulfite exporter TauE/SafE family protein [Bacteroidales bacterium]
METTSVILLIVFCMGASFVQRVSGFGFGIFIMTILPHLMPSYGEATALSGLLATIQSLIITIRMRKHVVWSRLIPILLTFIIVSSFAVMAVSATDDRMLKKVLGAILIVTSIYFFFISEKIKIKPSLPMQLSMGTVSGLMGGFFAMQGPPAVLYFVASEPTKESYLAMTQMYFMIGNIAMTAYRAYCGFVTEAVGVAWLYAVAAIFVGSYMGKMVFDRISAKVMKKVIYAYIGISGIMALIA